MGQRVFVNRVLRYTFKSMKNEVRGGMGKTTYQGASLYVLLNCHLGDRIKNEMGEAYSTYWGEERVLVGKLSKRDNLKT